MQEGPPLRVPPCSVDGWMETDHEVGRASMSAGLRAHLPGQTPHSGGLTLKRGIHTEANLKRENTYTKRSLLGRHFPHCPWLSLRRATFLGRQSSPPSAGFPRCQHRSPGSHRLRAQCFLGKGGTHGREARSPECLQDPHDQMLLSEHTKHITSARYGPPRRGAH